MNIHRSLRFHLTRFKRLPGPARSLALSAAVGAFCCMTPTLPLHNVLILIVSLILRVNPVAGLLVGNLLSNPLTVVPQYYLSWKIGDFFFPGRLSWEKILMIINQLKTGGIMGCPNTFLSLGTDTLVVMLTGGLALALPVAMLTYSLAFRFFTKLRAARRRRHLLNNPAR